MTPSRSLPPLLTSLTLLLTLLLAIQLSTGSTGCTPIHPHLPTANCAPRSPLQTLTAIGLTTSTYSLRITDSTSTQTYITRIELNPNHLTIVLLTPYGFRALTITETNSTITTDLHPLFPQLDPQTILGELTILLTPTPLTCLTTTIATIATTGQTNTTHWLQYNTLPRRTDLERLAE